MFAYEGFCSDGEYLIYTSLIFLSTIRDLLLDSIGGLVSIESSLHLFKRIHWLRLSCGNCLGFLITQQILPVNVPDAFYAA